MRLLISLTRKYPWQSLIMLLALLLAGVAEGVGLSALLPLLSVLIGTQTGSTKAASTGSSGLEKVVTEILSTLGLHPTLGILLLIIVCSIVVKSGMVLVAKKRVGYTVAHVATDLRLELLRVLRAARWEYFLSQPIGKLANSMATESKRSANAYLCGATMAAVGIEGLVYTVLVMFVPAFWRE